MTKNPYKCKFCGVVDIVKVRHNDCGLCCTGCGTRDYVMARKCALCYRLQFPKRRYVVNAYNCHMRAKYLAQMLFTIGLIIGFVILHTLSKGYSGINLYAAIAIILTIIVGCVIISTYPKGEWK